MKQAGGQPQMNQFCRNGKNYRRLQQITYL